uniref:NDUFA4 mitochondrial complex associated like 2b n=1 Tax=Salarias fasciatus TaxID=181472 RepID=A0A672GX07_SALFA
MCLCDSASVLCACVFVRVCVWLSLSLTGSVTGGEAGTHCDLIPQFFFISLGMTGATLYLIRLYFNVCVCVLWDKKNNPEPWNRLDPTYQYKVTSRNLKKEGPDF